MAEIYRFPRLDLSGLPETYHDREWRLNYENYINTMEPAQRVRWDLRNASQQFAITSKGYRRALREYLDALYNPRSVADWVSAKAAAMQALRDERARRAAIVSELRWQRDRPAMSPLGRAMFQILGGKS